MAAEAACFVRSASYPEVFSVPRYLAGYQIEHSPACIMLIINNFRFFSNKALNIPVFLC
ncbi:MAG: hypothetical protein HON65_08325 [Rhodospirillales bacterium]|nr:hypothetical protein [Rhodospirillales bacterium]